MMQKMTFSPKTINLQKLFYVFGLRRNERNYLVYETLLLQKREKQ